MTPDELAAAIREKCKYRTHHVRCSDDLARVDRDLRVLARHSLIPGAEWQCQCGLTALCPERVDALDSLRRLAHVLGVQP